MSRGEAGSNYEKTGGRKSRWTVHLKGQPVDWAGGDKFGGNDHYCSSRHFRRLAGIVTVESLWKEQ